MLQKQTGGVTQESSCKLLLKKLHAEAYSLLHSLQSVIQYGNFMERILVFLSVFTFLSFYFQPQFSSVLCSPLLCHASWSPVRPYSVGGWRCSCVCLIQTVAAKGSHGHRTGEVSTGILNVKHKFKTSTDKCLLQ